VATIFAVAELIRQAEGINGGCTIDSNGNVPDISGFVVGGKVPSFVMSGDESFVTLARWVAEHPSNHYGSWKDSETGLIHIDAVDFVEDFDTAVALGLRRGEIAIWDAGKGEEVRLAELADDHRISGEESLAKQMADNNLGSCGEYDPYCGGPEPDEFAGHYDESGY
jgi:hypothetical protein